MYNYPIADAHTDFLHNVYKQQVSMDATLETQGHVSRQALQKGNVALQLFAAFVNAGDPVHPTVQALEMIDTFHRMLTKWNPYVAVATRGNIDHIVGSGRIGALLTIEGGDAIDGKLSLLRMFHRLGVRVMTLTWNYVNAIGTPAYVDQSAGLTPFGASCVREMNDLRMAIDVSHLSDAGFRDALAASQMPLMASHSNARAVCDHFRNLDDWQIKALIDTKGFIGINFCSAFLRKAEQGQPEVSDLSDLVAHVKYILEMGGEDVLGLGSDFDGIDSCPAELRGAQDFQLVARALEKEGIPRNVIEKLCYGNLERYLRQVVL